jgi:tRNA1Val (adenine37-N6)-methyltransferase
LSDLQTLRETTEGGLLGGKICYRQFSSGHRSGFEPVLLAASVPAQPGELVLEAGCGAGAALLCLGHRVPGISGLGVEIDPEMTALANQNFKRNGLNDVSCVCREVGQLDDGPVFDHVMANPPWHKMASTQSADPLRALAHHANDTLLAIWINRLAGCLKPRGRLTLILPASGFAEATVCLRAQGFGAMVLFPLWPRAGKSAKIMLLAAEAGSRRPDRVLAGLVLHDDAGITPQAQEILRDGAALNLAG